MIKTLRGRLTAFNTAVTGVILIGVTVLCLILSEQDTRARTYQNFSGYLGTLSSYLGSQDSISADWLRQVESAGRISVAIYDGGKPLYSLRHSEPALLEQFEQVRAWAEQEYHLCADRIFGGKSCAFSLDGKTLGGFAVIAREDSVMELVLLYSLNEMEAGIQRQRLVVCLGEILALLLLWAFSWHFTGRMLRPIQESQLRQAQFTAAASHELRTPLAAVLCAASAMERGDSSQQPFFLGQIQSEGRRMSRLLGDMLSLSSGDSQNWALKKNPAEPDMLLLEVYEHYLYRAKEKGLTLSIHLPEAEIPPLFLDRERIYQVLAILLDNALAYTPAPGRISLALEQRKKRVCLLVSDTGPGVPDSEKEAIFQRFHRGEKARTDKGHFGLGLSIAAQIVTQHGGKLWVRDAELGGAEFVVELQR